MRQSFCWWCFKDRGLSDLDLLKTAAKIGYAGVEFLPEPLWPAAKDGGLAIATMPGHGTIASGFNDRTQHDRIADEIKRNLETAVKHGVGTMVVFSGNRRDGVSDADAQAITIEGLKRVATLAEQARVDLVMELLNSKTNHKGYQCDRTAWGVAVCERVASPRVKLLYDIYHMQVQEGDLIATIQASKQHIGHYHTAGVPGRHELDETQEIAYPAVFAAIRATGYQGYIGHEFIPTRDLPAGLKQAYELAI
jgi:hydroxypyruvate isomerase